MNNAELIQRRYYERSAASYDDMHSSEVEHQIAMHHINTFINLLGISSVLDVGCGTGRGLSFFLERGQRIKAIGIEPVQSLLDQAVKQNNISEKLLVCGSGEALPFEDNSFDAVCEFAILHHVKNPNKIVKEMARVARKAIFISDSNRFGQGRLASRILKLLLYKCGLWNMVSFAVTRGKGYRYSEEDGLFYSYSVFDSYGILADWADQIILIPTSKEKSESWFQPLLTSGQILVCAFKEQGGLHLNGG